MRRRTFLAGLGALGGASLFGGALTRMIDEARADSGLDAPRLVVLTDGNGWGHQSMGRQGEPLDTTVRSPSDWDLPRALAPLSAAGAPVTIVRPLRNPGGGSLHGSGWATLSAVNGGHAPGGISLDRLVARSVGTADAFSSMALGVPVRPGRPPPCVSSDGPNQAFPAFGSPVEAHDALFGGVVDSRSLARERSLLDAVLQDVSRTRAGLAAPERIKLDQLTDSYRALERRLLAMEGALASGSLPAPPSRSLTPGLNEATLHGHVDLIVAALSLGLTHVAHLSALGFDAHNVGWGFLGFGGDAHEQVAHVGSGYDRARSTAAYEAQIAFKSRLIVRLFEGLRAVPARGGTLADNTLVMWINSGGGKHHDGRNTHPMVLVGDTGTGVLSVGNYRQASGGSTVNQAFLSVAQAMGVQTEEFGAPEHCPGPLPELMR